jgi:hypothetical protein
MWLSQKMDKFLAVGRHLSHKKWPKAEDWTTSWQLADTSLMEGGVTSTLRSLQVRMQFVISTSSYVKLVDRIGKTAEKTHSLEMAGNHYFEKTCPTAMAAMM